MNKLFLILILGVITNGWSATITRYVNPSSSGGDGTTSALSGANAAYASLNTWEAAEQADLTDAGGDIMEVNCAGSANDTTAVAILGWTTGASGYIKVIGDATSGIYDASKYTISGTTGTVVLNVGQSYTQISNIQFTDWNGASEYGWSYAVDVGASNVSVFRNIIHNPNTATYYYKTGINSTYSTPNSGIAIYRNIIYEFNNYRNVGIESLNNTGIMVYNNTVYNLNGTNVGQGYNLNYSSASNNVGVGCGTADFAFGANMILNNYNASSDATATGANSINTATIANFVSVTLGSENLHLVSGAVEIDVGNNLGSPYDFDIDNVQVTGTWDIGADEFVATGGARRIIIFQ